jgi:hypothetical protein
MVQYSLVVVVLACLIICGTVARHDESQMHGCNGTKSKQQNSRTMRKTLRQVGNGIIQIKRKQRLHPTVDTTDVAIVACLIQFMLLISLQFTHTYDDMSNNS